MYLKGAIVYSTCVYRATNLILYVNSSLCRLEAEIGEVLGNKTYLGEEELEKLQYTEQVDLEELAIIMCRNRIEYTCH